MRKYLLANPPIELPGERTLSQIAGGKVPSNLVDQKDLSSLLKRPEFVIEDITKIRRNLSNGFC